MKIVPLDMLSPGLVLGKDLTDEQGRVLLSSGIKLTEEYIRALRDKGYTQLYVQEAEPEYETDIEPEEDVSPVLRSHALNVLQESFSTVQKEVESIKRESTSDMKGAFDSGAARTLMSNRGPIAKLAEVVSRIVSEIMSKGTLAGLTSMKSADGFLYQHSLDVCIISVMIGQSIGLEGTRLNQLATGALLHDIGMAFIDRNAPDTRRIRQHTQLGYELLKASDEPDILAPHVALEHHEHQDGTGLPRGLVGNNQIERTRGGQAPVPTLLGEITAIANAYDNLLSGGATRPALTPDLALAEIRKGAGTRFNRAIVTAFMRVTPVYPVGIEVIVRSVRFRNYLGVVAKINPIALDRPVVTLTHDNHGQPIPPFTIDLAREPDLEIRSRSI